MQITKEQIMDLKSKMLEHVQKNGPLIPVQLSKATGSSTIFAGAVLSELISHKQVKITNAKIGGSPLYYCHGQEEKIVLLREYLGQRPKQAFDLIKEHQILHDGSCEPWQRVALREIKDFAMPIYIEMNGQQEIFWRWYLLPEEDAIKQLKTAFEEQERKSQKIIEEPKKPEAQKPAEVQQELKKTEIQEIKPAAPAEVKEEVAEKKPKKRKAAKEKKPEDAFYKSILKMFAEKKIDIVEQKILKPGKEFNFVVKVPSNIGTLSYMAVARDQKKISDSDITIAFSEGLQAKMPVIYLSNGELSKKAETFINTHVKGLVFKKL